jgi:chromosome segregation ATPase
MGAQDIAKDAIRIATTAGLSKDVIDLLEKKIALLTEQIATLETEKANLKEKLADLEQQLDRLRSKEELHQDAIRFLKALFQSGELPLSEIARIIGVNKGIAEYHRDQLLKAEMIGYPMMVTRGQEPSVMLESKGRAYLVEHGHV